MPVSARAADGDPARVNTTDCAAVPSSRGSRTHMLTGYDHLLFLFGVVFFLTTFRDIAKFVTAFTLGHCITLVFATFLQIT